MAKALPLLERQRVARALYDGLRTLHPDAHCELDFGSPFQLLVATVLSAQTTDKLVNKVTPHLFAKFPDARALAASTQPELEEILRTNGLGMYRQKSKNIHNLAKKLVEEHGAEVPQSIEALVELPGVGRKTANVVLGVVWGTPDGVVTDTHVIRLSQRLGFTTNTKPEDIERDLSELFEREHWDPLAHALIFHGRRICFAIKPACATCGVAERCPNAFKADEVGRKNSAPPAKKKPRKVPKAKAKVGKAQLAKTELGKAQLAKTELGKAQVGKAQLAKAKAAKAKVAKAKAATVASAKVKTSSGKAKVAKAKGARST